MALFLPRPADLRHPLLERDYSRLCSRPAAFFHRGMAAAACGAIALFIYGATEDRRSADDLGRSIHGIYSFLAILFTYGLALSEGALAVPVERSAGTLTALLTVPLSPRSLAAGFLASRVLLAFTMLLAVLPIEGLALLVGGVSLGDVAYALGAALVTGVYGAGVGFLAGHAASNGRFAAVRAGLLSAVVLLIVPLALLSAQELAREEGLEFLEDGGKAIVEDLESATNWSLNLTPAGPLFHVLHWIPGSFPSGAGATLAIVGGAAGVWCLLALLVAGRRLRVETEVSSAIEARGGFRAWVRRVLRRGPPPEGAADLSLDFRPRVWRRPLLWKESRPPRNALRRWGFRVAAAAVLALYAWLFFSEKVRGRLGTDPNDWAYDFFILVPLWGFALVLSLPATAFLAEEREKGSLDLLRAAPFGAGDLVLARPAGILLRSIPFLGTLLLFGILGTARGQIHLLTLPAGLLGLVPVAAFLTLLCFQRGITAPSVHVANRRAVFVMVALCGYPFACGIVVGTLRLREWAAGLFAADPLAAMAGPMVLYVNSFRTWRPSRTDPALVFGAAGCVSLAVCGVLALFLWKLLPRLLRSGLEDAGKR